MTQLTPPEVAAYVEAHTSDEPEHLAALAAETRASLECPQMLTGPVEGRLLELLVFATGARRVLEIGTYSGYSALSMAAGLPEDGRIVTCEISEDNAAVARRHIGESVFADRIDLRLGPALETLAGLQGTFDLVFIDADKGNYVNYYEATLPKLAERGLIVADNTLWHGEVVNPQDDNARAIHAFNEHVAGDPRVICVQLTVRDGVTLIRRADDSPR